MTGPLAARADLLAAATQTLAVDAQTARVVRALRAAGVEPILLKGPSIASWLYRDGEPRPYSDTDLLVDERRVARAQLVLTGLGYAPRPELPGSRHPATDWCSSEGAALVDLHHRIWGWGEGRTVWAELQPHCRTMRVGGVPVRALDNVANAVHVATHALQPTLFAHWARKGQVDLQRALAQVSDDVWARAAELAARAGAADAFATSLHTHAAGRALCARLGIDLPASPAPEVASALAGTAHSGAAALAELLGSPSHAERAGMLRHRLLPPLAYARSVLPPRAGPRGPVTTYLRYWFRLARKSPAAARAWRASR